MIVLKLQPQQTSDRQSRLQFGVAQLAVACELAKEQQRDRWEFAIDATKLLALGLTTNDLRWLVSKGYAEHACEIVVRSHVRKYQPVCSLGFPKQTRFVLTDAGMLFAASISDQPPAFASPRIFRQDGCSFQSSPAPQWDVAFRVLRVGRKVIKRFALPAPNEETVLEAFQREGWPHRIDDPLRPYGKQNAKSRLHETIANLNRHHQHRLICFWSNGTGEGACWEYVGAAAALPPVASSLSRTPLVA